MSEKRLPSNFVELPSEWEALDIGHGTMVAVDRLNNHRPLLINPESGELTPIDFPEPPNASRLSRENVGGYFLPQPGGSGSRFWPGGGER